MEQEIDVVKIFLEPQFCLNHDARANINLTKRYATFIASESPNFPQSKVNNQPFY